MGNSNNIVPQDSILEFAKQDSIAREAEAKTIEMARADSIEQAAKENFAKKTEQKPNDADTYFERGKAKSLEGNNNATREAIEDFNKAIELNPNHADAYFERGICKSNLEDLNGACLDF